MQSRSTDLIEIEGATDMWLEIVGFVAIQYGCIA